MLCFVILNGFKAGKDAGHKTQTFDTALEEDIAKARAEFERLTQTEGRVALVDDEQGLRTITEIPESGEVSFLLPVAGG